LVSDIFINRMKEYKMYKW